MGRKLHPEDNPSVTFPPAFGKPGYADEPFPPEMEYIDEQKIWGTMPALNAMK